MPAIVIEASPITPAGDDVFKRSGFVAVLNVRERANRVEDLSNVLSHMIGVRVRQYGGLGSFATVSVRGSSSNQVEIYLDGVPLNDGYSGVTNLGDLPLAGIDRIELFRGATPPQFGSQSIGGAVNLVTQLDGEPTGALVSRMDLSESYGSFGTSRHVMSLWSLLGPARVFLHGSYMRSDGDFEFIDDTGTPENLYDDASAIRVNNEFSVWSVLGRMSTESPRLGKLSISHNALIREQRVPGMGTFKSQTAHSDRTRNLTHARWTSPAYLDGRLRTYSGGYLSLTNEQFHDPDGDLSFVSQDTDNSFRTAGGSARAKLNVPVLPVWLEALYEGNSERFTPRNNLPQPTEGPDRTRATHHGAVSADLELFDRQVVLSATQRFISQTTEFYDAPAFPWLPPSPQGRLSFSEQSPHIGFRWHPFSFATVKGNWGRYVRQPTMLELFGNVGSVTGSAALVPEEGTNRDIGVVFSQERLWGLRNAFLEVVYLNNRMENLILFFPNSQFTARPENISSARIRGWEVSFAAQWQDRFRVAGNYAFLGTEDTSPIPFYNGNQLPGRPAHDTALFADAMWRRWTLSYELHHIGRNFLDPANMREVPSREIHGVAVRTALFSNAVSLTAEGRNLGDDQISDVNGFPLPGRSFYMTLSFQPLGGTR
jgi:iron complex outermembrane receptor protein